MGKRHHLALSTQALSDKALDALKASFNHCGMSLLCRNIANHNHKMLVDAWDISTTPRNINQPTNQDVWSFPDVEFTFDFVGILTILHGSLVE